MVRYYRRVQHDETTYATTTTFVVNNVLIIFGRVWILVLFIVALTTIFSAKNGANNTHGRSLCAFLTHIVLLVLLIVSSTVNTKLLTDYFKEKTEVTYARLLGLFMI